MLEKQRTIARRHPPISVARCIADNVSLGLNNPPAGNAFRQRAHHNFANEIARQGNRIDRQFSARQRLPGRHRYAGRPSGHPLHPFSARSPRLERVAKILCFARHLPIGELHDAHSVRRTPVIAKNILSHPQITGANNPPHLKSFPVRLRLPRQLNFPPPPNALARLRIFEHRIVAVNQMLRLKVIRIRRSPVQIQSRSNLPVCHIAPLLQERNILNSCPSAAKAQHSRHPAPNEQESSSLPHK
jgi:hypothetical protein